MCQTDSGVVCSSEAQGFDQCEEDVTEVELNCTGEGVENIQRQHRGRIQNTLEVIRKTPFKTRIVQLLCCHHFKS